MGWRARPPSLPHTGFGPVCTSLSGPGLLVVFQQGGWPWSKAKGAGKRAEAGATGAAGLQRKPDNRPALFAVRPRGTATRSHVPFTHHKSISDRNVLGDYVTTLDGPVTAAGFRGVW